MAGVDSHGLYAAKASVALKSDLCPATMTMHKRCRAHVSFHVLSAAAEIERHSVRETTEMERHLFAEHFEVAWANWCS